MPFGRFKTWFVRGSATPVTSARRGDAGEAPKHLGELWTALQDIAREESPEIFTEKQVALHAAETLEGKKDVERWIEVLRKRENPEHEYRLPEHHERHRGYCLVPRHWPSGTVWEAIDDESLLRAKVGARRSRDELVEALDEWLDG